MGTPVENNGPGTEIPNGEVQGEVSPPETAPGLNPNWEPALNLIPQTLHPTLTPIFQQWDQAAQAKIESVNSKYKDFEPFLEHGITPEDLQQGIRLMNVINENPQAIYDALAEQLGVNKPQTQSTPEETSTEEIQEYQLPPDYDKVKQGVEFLAQRALDAETREREAQAQAQLTADIQAAEQKFGTKLNEKLFLPFFSRALNNNPRMTVETAAQQYIELQNEIIKSNQAAQPYAPNLLGGNSGGGAGLPSQAIDPTQLGRTETKALVVQMLKAAQGQQN